MELKYDIFISYARADQKVAEGICGFLENNGLRCFIDYRDIPRGAVWARVLPDAIRHSGMMVAVFSTNYNRSMQVERELSIADKAGIPVLPFRLSDTPYEGLKSYYFESINWIDAFPEPEKVFGTLLSDVLAIKDATENWQLGRSPSAGAVTMNLESIDSDIQTTNDIIDHRYEDDYCDGVDSMQHLEYTEAFGYLIEPALANYRQSQLYLSWMTQRNFIALVPAEAWPYLKAKAEEGNSFAEYMMSRYHSIIDVDSSLAFEYAARSARQGNMHGQYALAKLYDLGEGVEHDDRMGVDKIRELERLGFPPAMRDLARHYIYGFSLKKNPRRAIKILEAGVDQGSSQCMLELGLQKIYGDIMPVDLEGGRALLQQAVEDGMMEALDELAKSYLFNYPAAAYLSDPAAYRKFLELTNKGVKLNNSMSMVTLALVYRTCATEVGMKPDINMAMRWYTRATELRNRDAAFDLGAIYYAGEDSVEADEPRAWKWLSIAANLQSSSAEYYLGLMCFDGFGQNGEDRKDCVVHFENAIFLGGWGATEAALMCYGIFAPADFENGFPTHPKTHTDVEGFERSEEKALYYLRKGVNYDNSTCTYLLGCALTDTSRPYANEIEGIALLEKALAMPIPCYDAALRLHKLYTDGIGVGIDKDKAAEYLRIARENFPDVSDQSDSSDHSKHSDHSNQSDQSDEARKFYNWALPFCHEGASHWELLRAVEYLSAPSCLSYAPARELKNRVMEDIRKIYDETLAQGSPDFRILAQLMFAPLLKDPIAEAERTKAFESADGLKFRNTWQRLQKAVAAFGDEALPDASADFMADATALNKAWWLATRSSAQLQREHISPLDFERLIRFVSDNANSSLAAFVEDFSNCIAQLQTIILIAKKPKTDK